MSLSVTVTSHLVPYDNLADGISGDLGKTHVCLSIVSLSFLVECSAELMAPTLVRHLGHHAVPARFIAPEKTAELKGLWMGLPCQGWG